MADNLLDPSGNMNRVYMKLIKATTIKYFSKAKEYETMETKMIADGYLDALNHLDTFYTYTDYTDKEYKKANVIDQAIINKAKNGDFSAIPNDSKEILLDLRRQREIKLFEEGNDYYRMLNGYPSVNDWHYFYVNDELASEYNIDKKIPLHKIQDYYNSKEQGNGDYIISIIEGSGYIDKLIEAHPDKPYLKYIGSNRISINTSRNAKNFQIIQLRKTDVRQTIVDEFTKVYEQCREYFVKTIYVNLYTKIVDHYDNFIAMCIMIMTLQQLASKQISLGIKRNFFDIFAVKTLYDAYDIPYNLNIDEATQSQIMQNLNLLIQNKATDKVLYNIADLLGFSNLNIYKYYLTKEHKCNSYGIPIFKYTERFNSDTGETEVVPDYRAMYDLYFQKYELKNDDLINSFKDMSNRVEYNDTTKQDPFWFEDENVFKRIWETEYNAVESKYLSLGISYSMTEIMFENIIFLKLIMTEQNEFKNLTLKLPKIVENTDVSIFDTIILLLCLTAAKHHLWGEIISIPTQVISVVDYIENTERDGHDHDTFTFNYNYFFNPNYYEDMNKMNEMKDDLIGYMNKPDKSKTIVDTVGFNFDYFSLNNKDRENHINELKNILGEDDFDKFKNYVEKISIIKAGDKSQKIAALNEMYSSIKGLYKLINFYMTKTDNLEIYESLKRLYHSLFISKEVSDVFTITSAVKNEETGTVETYTRTAWTYFEFLYHKNPKLYNAIFDFDINRQYREYLNKNLIESTDFSLYDFQVAVAKGDIYLDYSKLISDATDESIRDEQIYQYVDHIIGRLEMMVDDIQFMYLMNDTSTPLSDLLLQLCRFFKSYTVDILGLDILFICDFKPENTIKLFDNIYYIRKLIQMNERLHMSYDDIVNKIITTIENNDKLVITDKMMYEVFLLIDELWGNRNSVRLEDKATVSKTFHENDLRGLKMFDYENINSVVETDDKSNLSDKVYKIWYD